MTLVERPLAVGLIAPGRRVGVTVLGQLAGLRYAQVFTMGRTGSTTGNRLAGIAAAARLTYDILSSGEYEFVPRRPRISIGTGYMYDDQLATRRHRLSASLALAAYRVQLAGEFLYEKALADSQPQGPGDAGDSERWAAIGELSGFVWRGYLELAFRYEFFDDNSAAFAFPKQQLFTFGLNAYLTSIGSSCS